MTEELLNSNGEDLVNNSNSVISVISATPICTEIVTESPCDKDYHSETESEKPVLLELGTSSNVSLNPVNIYPLDMHLPSVSSYIQSQPYISPTDTSASSLLASQLYSNPYNYSTAVGNVLRTTYPSHIPQTVCTWSTTDHLEPRGTPEIVPPPMYVSYMGPRELAIIKEVNPSWREKAIQIEKDYKKTACDRERTRMRDMNRAFDLLRSKLPISKPNGKKYSKIESLRIAINYIHHLQECLKAESPEITTFTMTNKSSSRSSASDYNLETDHRRQVYQFGNETKSIYDDVDKDHNKLNNEVWSESTYISNNHDKWD